MNRRQFLLSSALASSALAFPSTSHAQKSRGEFLVGQSVDLSGNLQNLGRDYFTGAKIAFDQANAAGGTAGRRWRLQQLDDGGEPERAVQNATRLIKEMRADALFGFTGDACVDAVLAAPALKSSGKLLFAPMCGVSLRADEGRAIYLRATYAEEVAAVVGQFAAGRMSNVALVHSPAATSVAARDGALALLAKRNLPTPALMVLKDDGSNVAALATALARTPPHAVVLLADTIPAALLARDLRGRIPGLFIGVTSTVDAVTLQQMLGPELSYGLIMTRVVPNPNKGTEPIVREFQRALTKYLDEAPTAAGLEGYVAARTLIETARRSPEAVGSPQSVQGVGTLDIGGCQLTLGKGERASRLVDTSMIARRGGMVG